MSKVEGNFFFQIKMFFRAHPELFLSEPTYITEPIIECLSPTCRDHAFVKRWTSSIEKSFYIYTFGKMLKDMESKNAYSFQVELETYFLKAVHSLRSSSWSSSTHWALFLLRFFSFETNQYIYLSCVITDARCHASISISSTDMICA